MPMLCLCKLAYWPSCCPVMDSHLVLLSHCILRCYFTSPLPSALIPLPCPQLDQLFLSTRHSDSDLSLSMFLFQILCAYWRQLRRVSLTLTTSMHILSWYLSCTSSHIRSCNLCNCSLLYGCLSFSIAVAWLSGKGMQQNSWLAFFSSAFSKHWINSPNPYKGYILYPFPTKHCSFLTSHFLHSPIWQAPHLVNSFKQK